jgi:SAM-dependent methyltransferase
MSPQVDRHPGPSAREKTIVADYRQSHLAQGKGESYDRAFRENPYRSVVWDLEKRALDAIVKRWFPARRVQHLDFACGTGRILAHLAGRVAVSVGVDVSPSMLQVARKAMPSAELIEADLTSQDVLAGRKFDLITAFRFFPNAQPELRREAMTQLAGHLAEDGRIVFNNHMNRSSALYRLARLRGQAGDVGMSRKEVDDLLASAGLRIEKAYHIGVLPATEEHPLLPRPLLGLVERAACRLPFLAGLSQDILFVCAHDRK